MPDCFSGESTVSPELIIEEPQHDMWLGWPVMVMEWTYDVISGLPQILHSFSQLRHVLWDY